MASPYPSVDELVRAAHCDAPHALVVAAARQAIAERRSAGRPADAAELAPVVRAAVARAQAPSLRPVINATGVILHTNLGRAPLAAAAVERLAATAGATPTSSSTSTPGGAARARRTSSRCCGS